MKTENTILEKSFEFSILIIELYKRLVANNEFVISKQVLRSATSIGANVREATAAQSKRDFISKMPIASKEARETEYWLLLLDKSKLVDIDYKELLSKPLELIKILTSIVKSAQQSLEIKN